MLLFAWAKLEDLPSSLSLDGIITDITQVEADKLNQAWNMYMLAILNELSAPVHLVQRLVLCNQMEQLGTISSYEVNVSQTCVTRQAMLLARGVTLLQETK